MPSAYKINKSEHRDVCHKTLIYMMIKFMKI